MPRLERALCLVARTAAIVPASTMAALASSSALTRVPSLSSYFIDFNVGACSVVGKKPVNVPHLDVIARCSSADPATSISWDILSEKNMIPRLTSRLFKDLVCDASAAYGRPTKCVLSSICSAHFSSYPKGFGSSASRSCAVRNDEVIQITGEADYEDGVEGEFEVVNSPTDEGVLRAGEAISGKVENEVEEELSVQKVRGERRRRASVDSPSCSSPPEWRDLLTVPGIGRRNMEKLVAKGIARLDELKQLYRDKYRSDGTEKMVEFLRSSVGVQKHHATSISVFLKNTVDAEEDKTSESGSKKRLTFCVEGNISVGKTTFLHRIANETIELRDLVEVVPEPIGKWQDVGPDHFNILDAFYGDPERYAYTFQNYVFVTRMMQERESSKGDKRLRLMERSVFSDRMVFVRAVHEAKWMSDAEISIYDSWFDPVVSAMPGLVPDAFIYLRATPDTCHRRLQSRNREEETNVTLDYLRGLHEKHEQWLFPAERGGSNVLSVSELPPASKGPLSPRLRDRVLYLQGDNVHSSIHKVPALVLDCEPSIDFTRDVEAKAEYARQVADFFEYVQGMKDSAGPPADSSSLVLPRGGLLGPDGNLLRPSSLEGVNLRRQISNICG